MTAKCLATLIALAFASCGAGFSHAADCSARANTSCNPSKGVTCCASAGLACIGPDKQPTDGAGTCKAWGTTPSTTPPTSTTSTTRPTSSSTTTSTTRPSPATTTTSTLPSGTAFPVSRWEDPEFMSRSFRDSQSILYDPRTPGQPYANQYVRQTRVETMWGPFFVEVLNYICDQGTNQQCSHAVTLTKQVVKFVVRYNFRDPGEPYGWGPNYVWDNWQAMLGIAADVRGRPPALVATLLRSDWPAAKNARGKKTPASDLEGIFDPQRKFAPLDERQSAALDAAGHAHHVHIDALVAWLDAIIAGRLAEEIARLKVSADALGAQVRPTQIAFVATARDPWEATLFENIFAGGIKITPGDAFADPVRARALTLKTGRRHELWHGGFNAHTGRPPNQSLVILAMWSHWLTHTRRATGVPLLMAEPIFDLTETTPTGLRWAALYPKCTSAAVLNGTYDVHYCPDIVE